MTYTPPTIKERGGLKVWLTEQGIDYDQFKELKATFGRKKGAFTSIAQIFSRGRKKALSPRTIAHWYDVDDAEYPPQT